MGNQFANNDLYVKYSQLAGILGTAVIWVSKNKFGIFN